MQISTRTRLSAALLLTTGLALTACSSGDDTGAETTPDAMTSMAPTPSATPDDMATEGGDMMASGLVGPGCADYAATVPDGAGSIEDMSTDPVATAASNNPLLTTLTAAVSGQLNPDVNLVDTLNGGEFTVFAPVDEAFAKIDPATIESLKTDAATLSSILTYHVVEGRLSPDQIAGEHTTVQGGTVDVTGSGDMLKVNDANVVCGGVQTANATVYLIDGVLMPTM